MYFIFLGTKDRLAYIFTDRLCRDMHMREMNNYVKNIKVHMKCFPNTDAKELKGYAAFCLVAIVILGVEKNYIGSKFFGSLNIIRASRISHIEKKL